MADTWLADPVKRDERTWTLKVCPECNSIGNGKSSPEFRENCRHDGKGPGWDIGRNVPRVAIEVVPKSDLDRALRALDEAIREANDIGEMLNRVAGERDEAMRPAAAPTEGTEENE